MQVSVIRDRAMLAVYYSCGLRRNEAVHLELNDIDYNGKLLYVRKGKGNKERYVPLTDTGTVIVLSVFVSPSGFKINNLYSFS